MLAVVMMNDVVVDDDACIKKIIRFSFVGCAKKTS